MNAHDRVLAALEDGPLGTLDLMEKADVGYHWLMGKRSPAFTGIIVFERPLWRIA